MTLPIAMTGVEADGYVNTGSFGSPTWVNLAIARDVNLIYEFTEADASVRGDGGFAATRNALQKVGADFEILWEPTGTSFSTLLAATNGRTNTEFLFLDGPVTPGSGAQGPRFTAVITKFARKEPLDNSLTADVSVRRTLSTNPTSWYVA